jgi:hypothetical protein
VAIMVEREALVVGPQGATVKSDDPEGPIYKLIEKVDGKWTDLVTAGVPWMNNQQIPGNRKRRVFYSKGPALTYRNSLRDQGREVRLVEYRALYTVN